MSDFQSSDEFDSEEGEKAKSDDKGLSPAVGEVIVGATALGALIIGGIIWWLCTSDGKSAAREKKEEKDKKIEVKKPPEPPKKKCQYCDDDLSGGDYSGLCYSCWDFVNDD